MQAFKAILFDMDGVIVDSEPLHERAFREVFAELGHGDDHGIDFTAYLGLADRALWDDFIALHHPSEPVGELIERKQRRLVELIVATQPIFPGLVPLLEKLAPRCRLAVASGSPHPVIDEVLRLENLRRFFPVVVSVTDVARGKPAPDVFLRAAALLGIAPAECCVIEDATLGVEAACAAGMAVIGITNSLPAERLARATEVVGSYAEIEALLIPRQ